MFHRSELGEFAALLPCDRNGQIPDQADNWREMDWGMDTFDACDADIIELLDDIWWPRLLELASEIRSKTRAIQKG